MRLFQGMYKPNKEKSVSQANKAPFAYIARNQMFGVKSAVQ